jgi:hypothetical protein
MVVEGEKEKTMTGSYDLWAVLTHQGYYLRVRI